MTTPPNALSVDQLNILHRVLSEFSDKIETVGLFGSRATNKARANSDIDLVLYGELDENLTNRIWSLLEDSELAVQVDVAAYHLISYTPLKNHIDKVMVPIFKREDLS